MEKNIAFLLGLEPDNNGRMVADYLNFSDRDWEEQHDVIQMAFPTKTRSKFHPNQPFLSEDYSVLRFTGDEYVRVKEVITLLLKSYLKSLGIVLTEMTVPVEGVAYPFQKELVLFTCSTPHFVWANSNDHNTLRLTRILDSLAILGLHKIQGELFSFLVYKVAVDYSHAINSKTVAFWVAARENKLHLFS